MKWQPIETAPKEGEAILTLHVDDLYPTVAFCVIDKDGHECWLRETEGPEDTYDGREGARHQPLYRRPTGWMSLDVLPDPPLSDEAIALVRTL